MGDKPPKVYVENVANRAPIWCIGWLFTIGFAKLTFWQGVLALLIWPYYLGVAVLEIVSKAS